MPSFKYTAYDHRGKQVQSTGSADSARQLRRDLAQSGVFPTHISEIKADSNGNKTSWWQPRLKPADLALVFRQLAILVNSGMTLEESLRLSAQQSESALQGQALESWRDGVASGYGFAASVRKTPFGMGEKVTAAIEVGEETGHLHAVLERVADELEVGNENRQALVKGMIYPAVMIVVAVLVISVLVGYVVPQVAKVFVNSKQELPLLTRATMVTSDFLRGWGFWLLVFIGMVWASALLALKNPQIRLRWHRAQLRLPLLGNWIRMGQMADWCRSLGMMLQSGVPVLSALGIATAGLSNRHLKAQFEATTERVREGNSLAASIRQETQAPAFMQHMISSGEASSELDPMLLKIADYYSLRLRGAVDTALKLLEPALIVFMGMVVMLIVGAVLVPIVRMNQLV